MGKHLAPDTGYVNQNDLNFAESTYKCLALGGPGISIVVNSDDLRILLANDLFERYLQYSTKNIAETELYFTDLMDGSYHERLLFQLSEVDTPEGRLSFVCYPLKSKDGSTKYYKVYASPVTDQSGSSYYNFCLLPELATPPAWFLSTATREMFLEKYGAENTATFEKLPSTGRYYYSSGVCAIYETEITDPPCSPFDERFVHPEDYARVTAEVADAQKSGTTLLTEFTVITARQNCHIVQCLAKRIGSSEQSIFAGCIKDITAERAIESAHRKKEIELAQSNKELEEFAYVASHDMQEPLRKITTFGNLLSEKFKEALGGDGLIYLSRMTASAENMRLLINDLLEFSRISKSAHQYETVDLNHTLRQVKQTLDLVIQESGAEISKVQLPVVDAVPSQMEQLFANIISNAIKFHKPGVPPVIQIECSLLSEAEKRNLKLTANSEYYCIAISDNGIGFEDEYKERIFQVFQRLHGKSEYPGSGIGLAICKRIAEYHHGMIYAGNIPGTGARFTFILPRLQKPLNTHEPDKK